MKNRCKNTGLSPIKLFLTLEKSIALRNKVDSFIDEKINEWDTNIPYAKHLEADTVNKDYYIRHLIETIWRIRLLRVVESKALAEIAKISPVAAQVWANYEMEEMLHDSLFSSDLALQGINQEQIMATEPYLSTKLLSGYFSYLLEHESPLGVVAYSYLVEYVNVKLEPKKIKAMKQSLGENNIRGQIAHSHTDINEDHPGEVWEVIRHLIQDNDDIENFYRYLAECQTILGFYFNEIYQDIIINKQKRAA